VSEDQTESNTKSNVAFCVNCGEEISAGTQFCPECGSNQDPSEFVEEGAPETTEHDGFTSWAIGFEPGETGRNILVGLAYFFFYPIGIPLLLYAYLRENPEDSKYVAYAGGVLLLVMSLGAFAQGGTSWDRCR
jgi:hypothetical protein